ncbi:unnamed protein product [Blepharisma stoltei]|uniref:SecA DEAD-like N-terminal domain-containing protein n=1 Tax=Blepharisma stoltei TaxID=1481888 RepID=A0AAU9IS62_9CILI|nr:unnamed protein product [Blepharisma stoltei]
MEFLNSITIAMQAFKFNEAEEKIKDIQDLNAQIIPLEIEKVRKEIDDLQLKLIQGINNCTIKDLKEFPQILEIEEAAKNYPVYREALSEIIGFINEKLETAKNAFPNMLRPAKKTLIDDITFILGVLPKETKESVEILIKDLKKNIKKQKKEIRKKIDDLAKEENISELCKTLRELDKQESQSDTQYAESKLREILTSVKSEIGSALFKKDWNIVFNKAPILTSKDELKDLINDSETTLSEIYQGINQLVQRALSTLLNIDSKDSSEELVEAWKIYATFMQFKTKIPKCSDIFDVNDTITKMLAGISTFYAKLYQNYIKELSDSNNLHTCDTILKKIKDRDDFLKIFKIFLTEHQGDSLYANCQQILKIQPYSSYVESLSEEVYKISEYFKNLKIEFSEIQHPAILEITSNKIQEKWNKLNRFEEIKNHLNPEIIDFEKAKSAAFESVFNEIDKIVKKAVSLIEKENVQKEDFKEIQICHSSLANFEKYLTIKGLNWDETVGNIRKKIIDRAHDLRSRAERSAEPREIAEAMISIKDISNNFPLLKREVDGIIDLFFEKFQKNIRDKGLLAAITQELESRQSGLGLNIITEHKFFEAAMQKIWASKTQKHGIEFALNNIRGANINKNELGNKYKSYIERFNCIQTNYWRISKTDGIHSAIDQMVGEIKNYSKNLAVDPLSPNIIQLKESYPELLAYLANLWGLLNIQKYQKDETDEEQKSSIFAPHPIQVLSIFRMLGIGYGRDATFGNNLVQILTGEGKSITLAFLCSILALIGFKTYCACYSSYLSRRDFVYFTDLYSTLGINSWIEYGTFDTLCENFINYHGNIREIANDLINTGEMKKSANAISDRPTVLLIDEVDFFFLNLFMEQLITLLDVFRILNSKYCPTIYDKTEGQLILTRLWIQMSIRTAIGNFQDLK